MENTQEKNQGVEGVALHDIVILSKYQKTGEDGKKLGYSYYEKDHIGVVTQVNDDKLVILKADLEEEVYNVQEEEKDYYYRIGRGSEVQYEREIEKAVKKASEAYEQNYKKMQELTDWLSTFKFSISTLGQIERFIKNFKN